MINKCHFETNTEEIKQEEFKHDQILSIQIIA